jgi:hypothetical protein
MRFARCESDNPNERPTIGSVLTNAGTMEQSMFSLPETPDQKERHYEYRDRAMVQ